MSSQLWSGQAFCVSHADGSGTFKSNFTGGLRAFFEYRNLGVDDATQGKYSANVIRAVPGRHAEPAWHIHQLDFQMIYILQGWVTFEYEGQGEVTFRPGSAALQPPGIRHREIRHSDDLELIEITSPAEFKTESVDKP
jgi:quercetin dioxygenase-like cupin family protein|tara:strand:+ start:1253 stop:1666 length:414 start_codon:yes stop_codon:yes gene_type:complete